MSAEASKRLKEVGVVGRSITLKIMKRDPSAPIEPPKVCMRHLCIYPTP